MSQSMRRSGDKDGMIASPDEFDGPPQKIDTQQSQGLGLKQLLKKE